MAAGLADLMGLLPNCSTGTSRAWTSGAAQSAAIPGLDLWDGQSTLRNGHEHLIDLVLRAGHERPSASLDEEVHGEESGSLVSVREPVVPYEGMGQRGGLAPDMTVIAGVGSSDRGLNGIRAENARRPSGLQSTLMCIQNVT
jgi:hypothetical protein